jgi:5-methylcytosine-specific restriction protein B
MKFEEMKLKLIQTCNKLIEENRLLSVEEFERGYKLFNEKFGVDKLKNLDGELLIETMFNVSNKDGLPYWLEFKNDDEFRTNSISYGSIAGGSSFKYVMFKRNVDGKWVTGNPKDPKVLTIDEAVELGRKLRDSLIEGYKLISDLPNDATIEDYKELQVELEKVLINNMHYLGWVHKYYHMLFPDKIDSFHNTNWQVHALINCNIKPLYEDKKYILAGQVMEVIKQINMPNCYFMNSVAILFGNPVKYYRVGTGDPGTSYWDEMRSESYIALGWSKLGDLDKFNKENIKNEVSDKLIELYDYNKSTASRKAGEILRFYNNIAVGDVVVAVQGEKVLGIGKVTDNYEYVENRPYAHCKKVNWIRIFNEPIKLANVNEGKLTSCVEYRDINNIMDIVRLINEGDSTTNINILLPPLTGIAAEVEGILSRKKQVILYGPPGTGKTYHAEKICLELSARNLYKKSYDNLSETEKDNITSINGTVRMCCFHPSYGYEDFIEGIKPRTINGQTVFDKEDGIFKKICNAAQKEPNKKFYLIIDEINRGDISRIFGELIMLIESGKRNKTIILPLSKDVFSVPENLYIIGTMNTADRSISMLDVALRRRFGFIELMPEYSFFKGIVFDGLPLDIWLKELNKSICDNLGKEGRNLQIGHSYFFDKGEPIRDKDKFKRIIKEDVIPLIEEYSYGDYSIMAKILGDGIIDTKNQTVRFELFNSSTSDLTNALLAPCPEIRTTIDGEDEIKIVDEETGDDDE